MDKVELTPEQEKFIKGKTPKNLLQMHKAIIDVLRAKKIMRTNNNPLGGYTEWLVCKALNLEQQGNSNEGYDAIDPTKKNKVKGAKEIYMRYEIKSRRLTTLKNGKKSSTQLSAIRGLEKKKFDYLIAVYYNDKYEIDYAYKIPHSIVLKQSKGIQGSTLAHRVFVEENWNEIDGVESITDELIKYHK